MFITKKSLPRRTFLRGVGATLALPLLDSMIPTTWLSGVRPKATQGVDAFAGVTADQIAAQAIGQDNPLPSMELATEDHSGLIGSCDRDYGCIYMNTLSWRTPETPLPMEINPRKVFERMFGQGGSPGERLARIQEDRSILDAITREAADVESVAGDRARERAPHPAGGEESGRRGPPAAGASGRRAVRLRGARRAHV
jgi:hypothetical protein